MERKTIDEQIERGLLALEHLDANVGRMAASLAGLRMALLDRLEPRLADLATELHHMAPASDTELQSVVAELQMLRRDLDGQQAELRKTMFEVMK